MGPTQGIVWACSCTQWGRGHLPTEGTHFKASSIIHGDLEELRACPEQPCSHTLQKLLGAPLAVPPRGHVCPHLGWKDPWERRAPPHPCTVPDLMQGGLAQHLPLF